MEKNRNYLEYQVICTPVGVVIAENAWADWIKNFDHPGVGCDWSDHSTVRCFGFDHHWVRCNNCER